jgi:hypothetical protein
MADRLLVSFQGEGSGIGELTWGQRAIWHAIQQQRCSMGVGGPVALPPGTTVEAVADGLRFAMGRHPSLRTRLTFDADGHTRQVVAAEGRVPLEIIDIAAGEDPAEVAAALRTRYHDREFDYANEWPVRMGIVRRHGVPTHVVALYCHLAIDGAGAEALVADLANRDPLTGAATAPASGTPPLELAGWQRSPPGQRQNERTLRHWEHQLRSIPARRFPESTDKRAPRFWEARFTSRATYLAVCAIAGRTGLDTSPVLLAAFAVALARLTGANPVVTQIAVGNRFRPTLADMVSTVAQNGLCVIDVADVTFDEVAVRAWHSAMSAYKNAYYDPTGLRELIARVEHDRGTEIDIDCVFNDRRTGERRDVTGQVPTERELRAATASSTMRWRQQTERAGERFFFHVNDVPDTTEIWLPIDSHCLSPADTEAFLRQVETVAVEAALDPAASTGIGARSESTLV